MSAINARNVWNTSADGTFIASSTGQSVIPLSGTFVSGNPNNADYRNPAILSGIEFTDISGAPPSNQFSIFRLDPSTGFPGNISPLIENTVIKCRALGGFPRLRFDLSSYGDRRNYFIKDHKFKLKVKALVGRDNSTIMGGGHIGAWIHTQPIADPESDDQYIWTWTRNQRWEYMKESEISISKVLSLSHTYYYPTYDAGETKTTTSVCLNNIITQSEDITKDRSLLSIEDREFEIFEVDFDTRNFTINNNFEYLDIIPIPEKMYKITDQVNRDDVNYIVELFFIPEVNPHKYLLIDSIELQDITLRENASLATGYGIETSGIPNRRFVKEDKLYLTKNQLRNIFQFYNGLIGQGTGVYSTNLASRDAVITSGIMELSGGSRLNYRVSPSWGVKNIGNTQANFNNLEGVELDN